MDLLKLFDSFRGAASREEDEKIETWLSDGGEETFEEYQRAHFLYEGMLLSDGNAAESHPRRRWIYWMAGVAAGLACIFAAAWAVNLGTRRDLMARTLSVETQNGQVATVTLTDGTLVRLNSGSRLEYPVSFGPVRRVSLTGEALFEVARDEKHPFIVSTYVSEVQVLGTRFDVVAREEEDLFSTALLEGSVAVKSLRDPSDRIVMRPGEIVTLREDQLSLVRQDHPATLCWLEGQVDLRCDTFEGLMRRFETVYGVTIRTGGKMPSTRRLSGEVTVSRGVDYALQVLHIALGIDYRIDPDGGYTVTYPNNQ